MSICKLFTNHVGQQNIILVKHQWEFLAPECTPSQSNNHLEEANNILKTTVGLHNKFGMCIHQLEAEFIFEVKIARHQKLSQLVPSSAQLPQKPDWFNHETGMC